MRGENEKAVTFAEMMHLGKSLALALELTSKMGNVEVAQKLAFILHERKQKEIEEARKMITVVSQVGTGSYGGSSSSSSTSKN